MRATLLFLWSLFWLLYLTVTTAAQEAGVITLRDARQTLELRIDPVKALTREQITVLSNINNYRLFEIVSPNDPLTMHGVDRSNLIEQSGPDCEFTCSIVTIHLTQPLQYGGTFLLKVNGLVLDDSPFPLIRFEPKPKAEIITSLDREQTRKELRIKSQIPMAATPTIRVEERRIEIAEDNSKVKEKPNCLEADVKTGVRFPANEFSIRLRNKLNEASAYALTIRNGVSDGAGSNVPAKGVIKIPGLPSPPESPSLDVKISTVGAVHQKPQFDFAANLSRPNRYSLGNQWYWEPKVSADLGLGQTKSKNAIVVDLPFRQYILRQRLTFVDESSISELNRDELAVDPCDRTNRTIVNRTQTEIAKIPAYLGWTRTPWHRLAIKFNGGPKFESDRSFGRINALGSARIDLRFHRLLATIKDKRDYLKSDLDALDEGMADRMTIDYGFNFIPYFGFDAGRRVTGEVVENKKKNAREVIPQFPIVRGNLGFSSLLQWRMLIPMTLTLNEDVFYLFKQETIGMVTDEGIGFRRLKGWHNRSTVSWDVYFDPAKRFSFNVTYENGRSAPNFEYLNKLSTGFRLIQ